ncbi:MAG: ATP-binding cassette domain-containing protein [Phycisphaerales bacterium]|nr:ATP-binding cassette domain-containing protein [Phycisphaerales bacterium]
MLELSHVTKRYAGVAALENCDLSVASGETTVLIGPSGCGKSTILRLMIGLQLPDAGNIRFAGQPLEPAKLPALRQRMGYVLQDGGLFPHLSARDNATLMAEHLGWSSQRIASRIEDLAELTHFPFDGLDRFPLQLSGGQQQRVSLMRALMLDPEVLLLDEPLGALDPMIRFELQNDLREIFSRLRKTVVMVTHDLGEAAFFGDTIVLLRDGRIVQKGTLREMLRTPADEFVTRFIQAQRAPLEAMEQQP